MSRIEWERGWDRTTSEASLSGVELRVECDRESKPSYMWEVRGYCHTRSGAFDAAERAAAASMRGLRIGSTAIESLMRAVQSNQARLLIDGVSDPSLLLSVLKLALEATQMPVADRQPLVPPGKRRVSDIRRKDRNVVRLSARGVEAK